MLLIPIRPWSAASTSVMVFALLMFLTIKTRQLRFVRSCLVSRVGLVAVGVRSSPSIATWNLRILSRCSGEAVVMNA